MVKKSAAIVLLFVLAISLFSPAAKAAEPIRVQVTRYTEFKELYTLDVEFPPGEEPRLVNGRVLVPLRTISESLNYKVNYDPGTRKITIGDDESVCIVLTVGSKQASINERNVELDILPDVRNGVTYVPLRFIAECFDAVVDWHGQECMVSIGIYFLSDKDFLFDERDSKLYLRDQTANKKHTFLTKLDFDVDWTSMNVVATEHGHYLVRFINSHGAPHVYSDNYDIYVADGKVVAEGHFGTAYKYSYSGANPVISADGTKVVIADNKNAVIYDDATLEPVAFYDLVELLGTDPGLEDKVFDDVDKEEETFYDVVAYGKNYLVVKSGLSKRMAIVHIDTGEIVWLYKLIYSDPLWLEYIEKYPSFTEDYGDLLRFVGDKDGQLYFEGLEWQTLPYVGFVYDLNRD